MKRFLIVGAVLVIAMGGAVVVRQVVAQDRDPVVIVHWANSHPMRPGLLPAMAEAFNKGHHETAAGDPIKVVVLSCDSAAQANDLVSRVKGAGRAEHGCGTQGDASQDPTIVTPQSSDWLVNINHQAGREVIDFGATKNIAETWLGIVTYRAMAECLGWPDKPLGYADIIALRADKRGWAAYPDCAQLEWGTTPLLAFTNPETSTSGRNVLISLYAIAAGKKPADLTVGDIERPDVVNYVKNFQGLVDHYMPGTIPLNTKIFQGKKSGHFFLMPEDNLVSLRLGNEEAIATDGSKQPLSPITDLVMIYPKEGATLNGNPGAIVNAPWVTSEQREAAGEWMEYLRSDAQQAIFADAGFRPPHDLQLPIDSQQFEAWGLNAQMPEVTLEPGDLKPDVLDQIINSWGAVKKPAVVTFVVDVSGSMEGERLEQVKKGLERMLEEMSASDSPGNNSRVGLVTFSDGSTLKAAPGPLDTTKFQIGQAVEAMEASGGTALYDAVALGVQLSDRDDADPDATRAVVVLSDGVANKGRCLDRIVEMQAPDEGSVTYCGHNGEQATSSTGAVLSPDDVRGDKLAMPTEHPVQVFFVGFGSADIAVGRILAQATHAEYQGSTEKDLASVIQNLSGYF